MQVEHMTLTFKTSHPISTQLFERTLALISGENSFYFTIPIYLQRQETAMYANIAVKLSQISLWRKLKHKCSTKAPLNQIVGNAT